MRGGNEETADGLVTEISFVCFAGVAISATGGDPPAADRQPPAANYSAWGALAPTALRLFEQAYDGCAQVGVGIVPELGDQRMAVERCLHDATLNAATAPVDDTQLAQTLRVRRRDVLFDNRLDVARRETVQIEEPVNGQVEPGHLAYSTVTDVLMPPRTEKSPTTFMRRGAQAATRSSRI